MREIDIVGISDELDVYEGYDSHLLFDSDYVGGNQVEWTDADRRELADTMIARWQKFKASIDDDAGAEQ